MRLSFICGESRRLAALETRSRKRALHLGEQGARCVDREAGWLNRLGLAGNQLDLKLKLSQ